MYEGSDAEERRPTRPERSGVSPTLIAFIVVAVVGLIFILQNGEDASIRFLFFESTTSVWVAIAIAIGIGVVLDRLLLTGFACGLVMKSRFKITRTSRFGEPGCPARNRHPPCAIRWNQCGTARRTSPASAWSSPPSTIGR